MDKTIKVTYIVTILSYLLTHISGLQYTRQIRDILLFVNLLILIIYFFYFKKKLYFKKNIELIIVALILIFGLYPIICINSLYFREIIIYVIENILFILNVLFISMYIYIKNKKFEYIKTTYLTTVMMLIIMYILNFDGFEVIKHISRIFSNAERYRASFGFNHPNTTAQLCFISLVLFKYMSKKESYRKFNIYTILNLVIWIILLSTSSRTAITGIFIFYVIFYIFESKENIKILKKKYVLIIINILLSIMLILILYLVYNNISVQDIYQIMLQSNRLLNFTINIPIVYEHSKELFGIGFLSPGIVLSPDFYYKMINIDNWFLYVFITLGNIGIVLAISLLIYIFISLLKNNCNNIDKVYGLALFMTFIYYSMFESIFLLVDIATSFIVWILFITTLYGERAEN